VHQFTQKFRRTGRFDTGDMIAGLGGCQMVAYRTDATDPLRNLGHLKIRATLTEFFQTTKLVYVEKSLLHVTLFVQMNGDSSVTFNSGHGFDGYFTGAHGCSPLIIFE